MVGRYKRDRDRQSPGQSLGYLLVGNRKQRIYGEDSFDDLSAMKTWRSIVSFSYEQK